MSIKKKLKQRQQRRKLRSKARLPKGGVRIAVYRSLNNIYGQVIDDSVHKTVASFSSLLLKDSKADKKDIAKKVGLELAKLAKDKGVEKAVFDRGGFLYHGRVKSFAEGLREGGLQI